jgi:hypothetical protein
MAIRDLSDLDRDINQGLGRQISENITDGTSANEVVLSEGGIIAGQSAQGTLAVSATKVYTYGTKRVEYGKTFRYAKGSTATALIAGYLTESPAYGGALDVVEEDVVVPASGGASSGELTIVGELKSSSVAANKFADGTIITNATVAVGGGQTRKISANTAGTTTSDEITYTVTEPWTVAITTGAVMTINANPFAGVLMTTTGEPLGNVAGVPRVAVPVATPYCWIQTCGPAAVHNGSTSITLGVGVHRDITSSGGGAIRRASETTGEITGSEYVGFAMNIADAHDYAMVHLQLE